MNETAFPYSIILTYTYRKNGGNRKSSFEKHHSNNCFRQESTMAAKISGWMYDEKWDIYMILKHLHTIYFWITNGKIITAVKTPSVHPLNKVMWLLSVMGQVKCLWYVLQEGHNIDISVFLPKI